VMEGKLTVMEANDAMLETMKKEDGKIE
jgi:hypothetical protein